MVAVQLQAMGPSSVMMRFNVTFGDLTSGAVAQTVTLLPLTVGSVVKGVRIKPVVVFDGGGAGAVTVSVGSSVAGVTNLFANAFDIHTPPISGSNFQMTNNFSAGTYEADALTATFTSDVALNTLTQGQVYIDVEMMLWDNLLSVGPVGNAPFGEYGGGYYEK